MMRRILVLGTTGSGKTTLGRAIADKLDIPFVELDSLHWDANWTPASPELFRSRVSVATAGDVWVVDGNYHVVREVLWPYADTAIWLDYPLSVILFRLFRRTVRRIARHEVLWNGNQEPTGLKLFQRDSLFVWAIRSYGRRRRQYPALFKQRENSHIAVVRLRTPRQTSLWLASVGSRSCTDAVNDRVGTSATSRYSVLARG